jgi:aminoglycoside phosphotransferase (APT) family kinase protein
MPAPNELKPHEILHSLGVAQPASITSVRGGMDTAIWRVEHDGRVSALRVFRPEQLKTYQREQVAMRLAEAGGIPVPHIEAAGLWQNRPSLLLSWSSGRPMIEQLGAQPWRIWSLGVAFGRQQAAIHAIHAPLADFEPYTGNWVEWAGPEEQHLQEHLRRLSPSASALLHLDYHPLNVLTQGRTISAVLDWANARPGDPRADLARTYTILRIEPLGPNKPSPMLQVIRWLLEKSWRSGYRQVAGPVMDSTEVMAPFYAWAGAVMARDLSPRVNKPGFWFREEHLGAIRHWTEGWKRRAGV